MHYSEDHRFVLAFCAKRANDILWSRYERTFDPEELMAEGWWRCLRQRTEGDLKPAITNTIRVMVTYAREFYVYRYGRERARTLWSGLDDDERKALNQIADPGPDPSHYVDVSDEVGFLQEHLDKKSYQLIENLTSGVWTVKKLERRRHVSHAAIGYHRDKALGKARKILEAA